MNSTWMVKLEQHGPRMSIKIPYHFTKDIGSADLDKYRCRASKDVPTVAFRTGFNVLPKGNNSGILLRGLPELPYQHVGG